MSRTKVVEDYISVTESDFTHTTSSTVWGPGALSGKALKALGEAGLDVIIRIIIWRRLASIKRTFNKQPGIFVKPEVSEEVRRMERDLQELRKGEYSKRIRQSAIALFIDMRTIRQRFGHVRNAWNSRRHVFMDPQSPEEKCERAALYGTLEEMSRPWYSTGIRRMAASVVHHIAEFEALHIHEKGPHLMPAVVKSPWRELEDSIKDNSWAGPRLLQ